MVTLFRPWLGLPWLLALPAMAAWEGAFQVRLVNEVGRPVVVHLITHRGDGWNGKLGLVTPEGVQEVQPRLDRRGGLDPIEGWQIPLPSGEAAELRLLAETLDTGDLPVCVGMAEPQGAGDMAYLLFPNRKDGQEPWVALPSVYRTPALRMRREGEATLKVQAAEAVAADEGPGVRRPRPPPDRRPCAA